MKWLERLFSKSLRESPFQAKTLGRLRGDQIKDGQIGSSHLANNSVKPHHLAEEMAGLYVQSVDRRVASLSTVSTDTSVIRVQPLYIPYRLRINRVQFQMTANTGAFGTGGVSNGYGEIALFNRAGKQVLFTAITAGLTTSGLKKYIMPDTLIEPGQYYIGVYMADSNIHLHSTLSLPVAGLIPRTGNHLINSTAPYTPAELNWANLIETTTPTPWIGFSYE